MNDIHREIITTSLAHCLRTFVYELIEIAIMTMNWVLDLCGRPIYRKMEIRVSPLDGLIFSLPANHLIGTGLQLVHEAREQHFLAGSSLRHRDMLCLRPRAESLKQ